MSADLPLPARASMARVGTRMPLIAEPPAPVGQARSPEADTAPVLHGRAVAYVMNGFPRLSETFIANEVHLLEQLGLRLHLYVVKREDEPKVHPVIGRIRAPLQYLPKVSSLSGTSLAAWLWKNLPRYARTHAAVALRRPLAWLGTAAMAAAFSWRYRPEGSGFKLRKVFIKEFLQAGHIAREVLAKPEIGHLHGHFCHGVATITWMASRMAGVPFSFTAHAKDIYQADLNPGDLLERKLAAARFVATCTGANAEVLKARHVRPEEVHTIYHGLDTGFFTPLMRRAQARPLILSVGRFVEKKGFDHLVNACARLRDAGTDFECLIVGEKGSAYEPIRAQIEALGLGAHVTLMNAVTQDELREIYARASVFALPCQVMADGDRDGIPNVLAEAMAMGLPVVSTNISGIPEIVDTGVHGLLVDSCDVQALADALQRVLTDPALQERLSAAARRCICERFDSQRTTVALRDLFAAELRRPVTA
jgi:glycosyltransferase involved in cell wall biosynthesis